MSHPTSVLLKRTCSACQSLYLHQRSLQNIAAFHIANRQARHRSTSTGPVLEIRNDRNGTSAIAMARHRQLSDSSTSSFPPSSLLTSSLPYQSSVRHQSSDGYKQEFSTHSALDRSMNDEDQETSTSLLQVESHPLCLNQLSGVMFKGLDSEFPCVSKGKDTGPEPQYSKITKGYKVMRTGKPFHLSLNQGVLPELEMAYETWGELNEDKSNAVIVLAGLSASSHAKSSPENSAPGWWEKFVGPGCAVDTDHFFVICPNNLGGCYGSSGPSSINKVTGKPYATTFPIIGVKDMTNAIFSLLDHLGIDTLYGAVGSSLGGMLSLQSAVTFPDRVGRFVSISSCAQSHPSSIAMRYLQRKCIMTDPAWNNGHYYDGAYPKSGMKLAREIATITYRSGPEWDQRFGRRKISEAPASLCPTFLIESYLEHQGESFSTMYDPNSLLYMSKAMDMFDLSEDEGSLKKALERITCPAMVIGVQTDILFPIWQQRELAEGLQVSGNEQVTFYELNSIYGHDTFLLDLNGVGAAVKGFLETKQKEAGWLTKHKQ